MKYTEKTPLEQLLEKIGPIVPIEIVNEMLDAEKREHQRWFNKGFEFYHEQLLKRQTERNENRLF